MKPLIAGLLVTAMGCATDVAAPVDQVSGAPAGPAYLEIQFTDTSGSVQPSAPLKTEQPAPPPPELWVSVSRVEIEHADGRWITVSAEPQRFDLFAAEHGNAAVLASTMLPPGDYRTLAVEIDGATLVTAGVSQNITIDHGSVLISIDGRLGDDRAYALLLDLDSVKSLTQMSSGIMQPALSVMSFDQM